MHRIILDTDPGIDDALAFLLAVASPEIQLEAVTTVNGNVGIDATTANALGLLTLLGRADVPVARGAAHPLLNELVDASDVHGYTGLGTATLPALGKEVVAQHAANLIVEQILANPGEITLVAVGPLTNLALAVRLEPSIARKVKEVFIMGGALRTPGNTTASAEFNIYADPHAAHIVFHAGWPIRLVSLDVTEKVTMNREQIAELSRGGGKVKTFIREMTNYYFDVFSPMWGTSGLQFHDPLCLGAVIQPDLIQWESAYVDVELAGTLTQGQTVPSFKRMPGMPEPNILGSLGVDGERFLKMFRERIDAAYS